MGAPHVRVPLTGSVRACVLSSSVFTWPSPEPLVASDVAAAAAWLQRVARVYVSMISDIDGSSVSFVETLPGGGAGAQLTVDPISQSWMQTQLGATWTASVDKAVVATMKVRSGRVRGFEALTISCGRVTAGYLMFGIYSH